jgi:hypothetical protein
VNATDAFYEKLDAEIEADAMAEFKKLCDRNNELACQNLAFRIALRNAANKFEVMRNKQEAGKLRAILALHPEGV